jgi:hypothetical protein
VSHRWIYLALAAVTAAMAVLVLHNTASAFQSVRAGYVTGVARDENGRPMAGVEVTARYGQSSYYVSHSRSARTNAQGRYSLYLADRPGTWTVYAKGRVDGMMMDLVPNDDAPFAGNVGAVRDFRAQFIESTETDAYGTGAMLVVQAAIGDYTDMMETEVTLRPVNGGAPIVRRFRNTGEGYVVTGLRNQRYEISVTHNGRPMLISPQITVRTEYQWGPTVTLEPVYFGAGIYHMRAEVKQR